MLALTLDLDRRFVLRVLLRCWYWCWSRDAMPRKTSCHARDDKPIDPLHSGSMPVYCTLISNTITLTGARQCRRRKFVRRPQSSHACFFRASLSVPRLVLTSYPNLNPNPYSSFIVPSHLLHQHVAGEGNKLHQLLTPRAQFHHAAIHQVNAFWRVVRSRTSSRCCGMLHRLQVFGRGRGAGLGTASTGTVL